MRSYLIRRFLLIPFTLLGVTFLVFCITRMVPGGPVEQILQQQTIGALAGDKAALQDASLADENDVERLEEMFNLQEPIVVAYLQWLGLVPRKMLISKTELEADGSGELALAGEGALLRVQRKGAALFPVDYSAGSLEDWASRGWRLSLESPRDRAERWARRRHISDERAIADRAGSPLCRKWRAVAWKRDFCGIAQGNFGNSYKYNEPVWAMMAQRIPVSLYFGLLGSLITYAVSIPLGMAKAVFHKSWFDNLSSTLIFLGYAVPGFALGAVLVVYLGARFEIFPLCGLTSSDFDQMDLVGQALDLAHHTALPLLCYVVPTFAVTTMMMKNNALENLSADYMRTAIAKGAGFRRAVIRHAFRNSLIPIISGLGGLLSVMVGGSILIERVFDIQGFGLLSYQALMDKDYSLIMGTLLLTSFLLMLGNLIADTIVAVIDPRIQFK